MTAEDVLREAARLGVSISIRDGKLVARPREAITPELREAIRSAKDELRLHLASGPPDGSETMAKGTEGQQPPSDPAQVLSRKPAVPGRPPAAMTPEERVAELAAALAAGYLRLLVSRRKALAEVPRAEALCAPVRGGSAASGKDT